MLAMVRPLRCVFSFGAAEWAPFSRKYNEGAFIMALVEVQDNKRSSPWPRSGNCRARQSPLTLGIAADLICWPPLAPWYIHGEGQAHTTSF